MPENLIDVLTHEPGDASVGREESSYKRLLAAGAATVATVSPFG